jgi:hypothetical protein
MSQEDPLRSLVIDADELDRARIAEVLRGILKIDKSGRVLPDRGFRNLDARQKVLAFLLGRKVAVLLELTDTETIGPKDLATQSGVATGTVRPAVRKLAEARLVSQDADSSYFLGPHQVSTAIDLLVPKNLDSVDSSSSSVATSRVRPGTKRAAKSTSAAKKTSVDKSDAPSKKNVSANPKKSVTTAFSPTNAIRGLAEEGFFDSPKSLSDVQQWLKDKKGRIYSVNDLSPIFTRLLRSNVLDRDKDADGKYVYTRSSG